ncbi:MAG: ABC transporter permease [Chitinophagales bacterium]|nr:ABC transporter permease [Chitinophagales bacterium]
MIVNYLRLALRKLSKQREYTLLNILGLGLSIACCLLIFIFLRHHTSFDTYHSKADRIFQVVMDIKTEGTFPFSGAPSPMADALRSECALLERAAMRSAQDEVLISVTNAHGGVDKYKEKEHFAWVEPDYFEILDLPFVQGNYAGLNEPNTVVLSASMASKYFGSADPLGKVIRVNNEDNLKVIGILKDLPANTDYHHNILASWATLKSHPEVAESLTSWSGARGENYCLGVIKAGHNIRELDQLMMQFRQSHPHPESKDLFQYKIMSILDMHSDMEYGFGMDKKFLWALGLIGIFLLVTACVNFVNMATAQALHRGREVGVRKSLGSTQRQLFWQFMAETGLVVGASLIIGFGMAWLALPQLNAWLEEDLQMNGAVLANLLVFSGVLGLLLTFLAGAYPAIMQARFNPVTAIKGSLEKAAGGGISLRKILVTTQFSISQVLIIGVLVVTAQMKFAQEADWGFRPGTVVTLELPEKAKMKSLQQQLAKIAGVASVSLCYQPPASSSNNFQGVQWENRPEAEAWLANDKPADEKYLETFGLTLVAGRNLQAGDTTREFLVNETFVKKLNLASPEEILNKQVVIGTEKAAVVGVIKDYHNWSLSEPIAAISMSTRAEGYATCAIQLVPGNPAPVMAQIREVWEAHFPDHYYEQTFMDERLGDFMATETMIMRLVRTFAGIAVFVGCLGLYGLSTFMITRKRKEMGIRKTLGANVPGILWLFGREYIRLILIAFALATPVAWWAMSHWLNDYTYRFTLGAGVFLLSLGITLGLALFTVGSQSIKAALDNPVEALRSV